MSRIFPKEQLRANWLLWVGIIGVIAAELAALPLLHLKLDASSEEGAFAIIAICLVAAAFYRFYRRDDGLCLFACAVPLLICGSFAIETATYLFAYMGQPLVDQPLIEVDAALGLDWREYISWINRNPQVAAFFNYAYGSCGYQFLVLLPFLFTCAHAQGQRLYIALYVSGLLCALLSGIFPAVGAYIYYDISSTLLPTMPESARVHEPLLNALLHHTTDTIPYPGAGIVTFPSYHTAVAVLLIYGAWPYRYLRFFALPLNLAVVASTPFDGGHYFTDIIGGVFIAGMGAALAEFLLPRRGELQPAVSESTTS